MSRSRPPARGFESLLNPLHLLMSIVVLTFAPNLFRLAACAVLLFVGLFGVVMAAVSLSKDTKVSSDDAAGRQPLARESPTSDRTFMTKDNHPIATNTNKVHFPLAAAAFVPADVSGKISTITVAGAEGEIYHRKVMSLDIVPNESLVLETFNGEHMRSRRVLWLENACVDPKYFALPITTWGEDQEDEGTAGGRRSSGGER